MNTSRKQCKQAVGVSSRKILHQFIIQEPSHTVMKGLDITEPFPQRKLNNTIKFPSNIGLCNRYQQA